MKKLILKIIKWILDNLVGVVFIGFGFYLLSTKEWKLGGLYLLFFGIFIIQNTKIQSLEDRICRLEDK